MNEHDGFVWQIGRVVRSDGATVLLELPDPAACGRCRAGQGCGAGQFARLFGRGRALQLSAPSCRYFSLGATVQVGIDSRWLLLAAAAAYLIPVLAFIGGALVAGAVIGDHDLAALAAGLLATAVASLALRHLVPGLLRPELHIGAVLETGLACTHFDNVAGAGGSCIEQYATKAKE